MLDPATFFLFFSARNDSAEEKLEFDNPYSSRVLQKGEFDARVGLRTCNNLFPFGSSELSQRTKSLRNNGRMTFDSCRTWSTEATHFYSTRYPPINLIDNLKSFIRKLLFWSHNKSLKNGMPARNERFSQRDFFLLFVDGFFISNVSTW